MPKAKKISTNQKRRAGHGRPLTAREQIEEKRAQTHKGHVVKAEAVPGLRRPGHPGKVVATGGKVVVVKPGDTIEVKIGDEIVNVKPGDVIQVKSGVGGKRKHPLHGIAVKAPGRNVAEAIAKATTPRSLRKNQSVSFEASDIVSLYRTSPDFRRIAESGKYVYADGRIVLYEPGSISIGKDAAIIHPTAKANKNPLDHCLSVFKKGSKGNVSFEHPEKYKELSQKGFISSFVLSVSDRLQFASTGGGGGNDDDGTDFIDDGSDHNNDDSNNPIGWTDTANEELERIIKDQIKREHTSIKKLAAFLGISDATISRFWTDTNSRPELANVIAVCLALHMSPPRSEQVIHLTGYYLRDIPLERTYQFLISMCYTQDLKSCNEILEYAGYDPIPLTSSKNLP